MEDEDYVVVAGSGVQEAAERVRVVMGTRARVLIVDDVGDWHGVGLPALGEPLLCGVDLACEPEIVAIRDHVIRMPASQELLTPLKRTHPTTARELRRAERQRRR